MKSEFKKRRLIIGISVMVMIGIFTLAAIIVFLYSSRKGTVAYLYDESNVSVNYSVAQLKFDLSSNHMYYYYTANPTYTERFEPMLDDLADLKNRFEGGSINKTEYEASAKQKLAEYYPSEMIIELNDAWNSYNSSQSDYDEATRTIYNTYSNRFEFMFRIRNVNIERIDNEKGIWYYYVSDLLSLYYDEFVVQKNSDGVLTSTLNLGVKLRGGTTFSGDTANYYYDTEFNKMVTAYTMKFVNSGTADMYMAMNTLLPSTEQNGVLAMILPYNFNISQLAEDAVYNAYVDENGNISYHDLIVALLKNGKIASSGSFSTFTYAYTDSQLDNLNYTQLSELLTSWNACAIDSYKNYTTYPDYENFKLSIHGSVNPESITEVQMGMLCWADYETCEDYYARDDATKKWESDDAYELMKYNFTVNIKASLKDLDFTSNVDYTFMYNDTQDYQKFIGVSNFDVEGYAYFLQGDGTKINAKNHMQDGYIICNYTNSQAENYIDKIRFNVNYRGFSPAYIRVRFIEQFTNAKGEIVAINRIKFNLADNWYDNRMNDMYLYSPKLYSSTDKDVLTTTGKAKLITVPVIDGLSQTYSSVSSIDPELAKNQNLTLQLSIYIEAVQPNRTQEYWGIDVADIPTEDAG